MPANNTEIEKRLWGAADELRANSRLKPSEYSVPVLGLIFLRYADHRFARVDREIKAERAAVASGRRQRPISKDDYLARGVLFLPDEARFERLVELPEGENTGRAINAAMKGVETENPDLKDVLPKTYNRLTNATLVSLLKMFYSIQMDVEGDVFGKIYEYFLANSAADARGSELEIRQRLIESGAVDVMVAVGSNFFYTVTLPCTLWFQDSGKRGTDREDRVLFIDARRIYTQVDRAHREFTPEQIEFLADIVRLYRGREVETAQGSAELVAAHFPDGAYRDVPGLCGVATRAEIEAQGWSLNPGRYVGVPEREEDEGFDFAGRLVELQEELEVLNAEAHELEERIADNVSQLLGSL